MTRLLEGRGGDCWLCEVRESASIRVAAGRVTALIVSACALSVLFTGCGGSAPGSSTPAPMVIQSVSPLPRLNNPAFTMQVYGSGFISSAVVMVTAGNNGGLAQVPTTYIDARHLTADIPANVFTIPVATIYGYVANPPNCTNQYCNLGWWSNAFQVQEQ